MIIHVNFKQKDNPKIIAFNGQAQNRPDPLNYTGLVINLFRLKASRQIVIWKPHLPWPHAPQWIHRHCLGPRTKPKPKTMKSQQKLENYMPWRDTFKTRLYLLILTRINKKKLKLSSRLSSPHVFRFIYNICIIILKFHISLFCCPSSIIK